MGTTGGGFAGGRVAVRMLAHRNQGENRGPAGPRID
jgi:hypothetical protein